MRMPADEQSGVTWLRYSFYLILALTLTVFVSTAVALIDMTTYGPFPAVGWVLMLAGPLLVTTIIARAAFYYRKFSSEINRVRIFSPPAVVMALLGSLALLSIIGLTSSRPVGTAGFVAGIILEVAGIGALTSAAVLTLPPRGSTRPNTRRTASKAGMDANSGPLDGLDSEILEDARHHRRSSHNWAWLNYGLGFLTATLSGAAGITLLTDAPEALKSTSAVLAVVGAGLAALTPSLGAAENQQRKQQIATELESLSRTIRWRQVPMPDPLVVKQYVQRYNRILSQNSDSMSSAPADLPE